MNLRISGTVLALAVSVLLGLFIVIPLGAVLIESLTVSAPLAPADMRSLILRCLDLVPREQRDALLQRWSTQLTERQWMEATAGTLEHFGLPVAWNRRAAFDEQVQAARSAVDALPVEIRQVFEREFPIQVVVAHRRIALAFQVREQLSTSEFDALRSGRRHGVGFRQYTSFLTDARLLRAARNSLGLSIASGFLTVCAAYGLAFGLHRGGIRFPAITRAAVLAPLVSPPVIIAFAAILLFGRRGLVTKALLQDILGWINAETTNLYGVAGVVFAQVLSHLPHAFIVLENVLAQQDGRMEESAAAQGGTSWQVFRHVSLPLTWPGIVRAFLIAFILGMTDFGNPLIIGRDVPVLAGVIYDEILGFQNKPLAAALCVWLILPTLGAYLCFERFGRRRRYASSAGAGGASELPLPQAARTMLQALAALVVILVGALYATVVMGSFVKVWGIDFTLTLAHYLSVDPGLAQSHGFPTVWTSVRIAACAAPLGGLLSIGIAYLAERVRPTGREAIAFVSILPAILPGVILGIGYLVFFNNPFGRPGLALTGTAAILILNILFANLYVGVMAGRAALQRLDTSVDEAAAALGASVLQTFRLVTLPMIRRAVLLSTLYVFVHGITTLSAVIFLVSPEHKLASVGIFLAAEAAHYGLACATSTMILVLVFGVLAVGWRLEESRQNLHRSVTLSPA
jgi:iron(III) transport system permease protein